MEDPSGRAREQLSVQDEAQWGGPPRRRRSRESLWVLLFIVLSLGAIWITLQREDQAAADDPRLAVQRGEVVGLAGLSMARPQNLRPALARMDAMTPARDRVLSMRVSPALAQVTLVTPAGQEYFLEARAGDDEVRRREFAETSRTATARIADIAPADVRRAVATVASRSGLGPAAFEYLVLSDPGPDQAWFVRFEAPTVAQRDWPGRGRGGQMQPTNAPPRSPARPSAPSAPASGNPSVREQLRILECVQEAEGDIDAIQRCVG
ncbi:MAG: hypothetical protein RLN63_03960 [Miltoncostaeaceae bacterium]